MAQIQFLETQRKMKSHNNRPHVYITRKKSQALGIVFHMSCTQGILCWSAWFIITVCWEWLGVDTQYQLFYILNTISEIQH